MRLLGGLVLAAVLAAGCGSRPGAVAMGSRWRVEMFWIPRQLRALRPVEFTFRVTGPDGRPATVAEPAATAEMKDMTHQQTVLVLRPLGTGVYAATHTFSMDGRWTITLAGVSNGARLTAVVTVDVGP